MKRGGSIISLVDIWPTKVPRASPHVFLLSLLLLSSEDVIYRAQSSSRVPLDGVQLSWNQRGEFQPPCFSVKENVMPGELTQSKGRTWQTGVANKTKSFKGRRGVPGHLCLVPWVARKEASRHFCVRSVGLYFSGWRRGLAARRQHLPPLAEVQRAKHKKCGSNMLLRSKNIKPPRPSRCVLAKFRLCVGIPTALVSEHFLGKHFRSLPYSLPVHFSSWCPFLPHFLTSHFP